MKKISVITPVFNEEATVAEVYKQIKKVSSQLKEKYTYEHIFLDNYSQDKTVSILKKIASKDKKVKVLVYSKNFGVLKSMMTGLKFARGQAVIFYEANLKDPPSLIPIFIKHWERGFDVVYGVRKKTGDETLIMPLVRKIFYCLIKLLSEEEIPLNAGEFRLIDRKVVNELIKLDDYKPYLRGLVSSIGFKQIGIAYNRRKRFRGRSTTNFAYLLDYAINALVSYSLAPIRLCTYLGLALILLSLVTALIYLALKLFFWPPQIPAITGFIIIFLIFSGIQMFFLGIIGEYIAAIHSQVRQKPFIVIKEKINF